MTQVYFDHNSTSPMLPIAMEAWVYAQSDAWMNASAPYRGSARVNALFDNACERIAERIDCKMNEVVFTSGASEGITSIFFWLAREYPAEKVLLAPTEHTAVQRAAEFFFPGKTDYLDANPDGSIDLRQLEEKLLTREYAAVAVMAANNETGLIHPWKLINALCRKHKSWYICDATQWMGKLESHEIGICDFLVASAHKFGGSKGCGLLKLPAQIDDFRLILGGEQQEGRRAGTVDYPGIIALVEAFDWTNKLTSKINDYRGNFLRSIANKIPDITINTDLNNSLWNTLSIALPKYENIRWIHNLDQAGFLVSTGAACSFETRASKTLQAIGKTSDEIRRTIRISSSWNNTEDEWQELAEAMIKIWNKLGHEDQ